MKNAIRMAMEFEQMLTVFDNPEYTDGYEGFHHLGGIEGDSDHTTMHYIVRDHDAGKLNQKLAEIDKASEYLNFKYGEGSFKVVRTGSYQNMKEMILPHMHLVEYAKEAMRELGLNAKSVPMVQDYPLWDFHVRTSAQEALIIMAALNMHVLSRWSCVLRF